MRYEAIMRNVATLLFAATLLCCHVLAQNAPKHKSTPAPLQGALKLAPAKPGELSKEFMALGRKAFAAIDRLNEHLLDTKDLTSDGSMMELSDDKESWTLRAVAAEKASDDLQAVAESPGEKRVAQKVSFAILIVEENHNAIDAETSIAVSTENLHELQMQALGISPVFRRPSTSIADASKRATEKATIATKEFLSGPCYLAAKEAVSTGLLDSIERCDPPVQELRVNSKTPIAVTDSVTPTDTLQARTDTLVKQSDADQIARNNVAARLTDNESAARAEGQVLIWTIPPPTGMSPEDFAAAFKKRIIVAVDNESNREKLRSYGFTQTRLETGGKSFEWPFEDTTRDNPAHASPQPTVGSYDQRRAALQSQVDALEAQSEKVRREGEAISRIDQNLATIRSQVFLLQSQRDLIQSRVNAGLQDNVSASTEDRELRIQLEHF